MTAQTWWCDECWQAGVYADPPVQDQGNIIAESSALADFDPRDKSADRLKACPVCGSALLAVAGDDQEGRT